MPNSQVGTIVCGRYELLSKLGSGGMGSVYKAKHIALNKLFAIKILDNRSNDLEFNLRFDREAKASSLLEHPALVSISDYGLTDFDEPFIVMDLIDGVSLARELARFGPIKPRRATKIFQQLTEALSYAHDVGIVHRDLKPGNIMVINASTAQEHIKIIDFGIAKMQTAEAGNFKTAKNSIIGSPFYMSPEQCQGGEADNRSDVYSMGCVMYECLTGAPPLKGESIFETISLHVSATPEPFSADFKIPHELESIIFKALKKSPDERFQTMEDLKSALDNVYPSLEEPPESQAHLWNKSNLAIASGAALFVAAALILCANSSMKFPWTQPHTVETASPFAGGELEAAQQSEWLERFGALPKLSPEEEELPPDELAKLCQSNLKSGEEKKAISVFAFAAAKYSESTNQYKMLSDYFFQKGQEILKTHPNNLKYMKYAKVIDDIILLYYRDDSAIYVNRADCHKILGNLQAAMHDYQRALRTFPATADNTDLSLKLALCYEQLAYYDGAIKICSEHQKPQDLRSLKILVDSYASVGRFADVEAVTNNALKAKRGDFPDDQSFNRYFLWAYTNRGMARNHLKKNKDSLKDFDTARAFARTDQERGEIDKQIKAVQSIK